MSLVKNTNNSAHLIIKKSLNYTTQITEVVHQLNKKSTIKNKTNKLIKTLNNQINNSNLMTQDDIDKMFNYSHGKDKYNLPHTKVSTQAVERQRYEFQDNNHRRNFIKYVKFLQMEDEDDKFLSGLKEYYDQEEQIIQQLFAKQVDSKVDLTTEFKKNYLVGKIIGEGAYASVRVAIYKPNDKKIAIKIYQKSKIKQSQRKKSVRRQIKILQKLQHPNIVKILDVVQTNNHLNIVMQYLTGNSLSTYLKLQPNSKIGQKNVKKIFKALTKALKYMHQLNIAHRDIKLQNIILDQELNPKIIDFGFSTCIEPNKKIKIFCGTPSYMAPQVIQRKQYRGENADIWALGVMLFVSLTGIFPFKGSTDQQLYKKINNSDYPKSQLLFSRPLSDLISKMLKIDPDQRITANQILKHAWFIDNKTDSSKKKNIENSLDNNRKRINTINCNATSKDNKWANRTGIVKKVLLQTTGPQNLHNQFRLALKSPKLHYQQQINSHRIVDKQNTLKFLKSQKNTHRGKQSSEIKQKDKDKDKDKEIKQKSNSKLHPKVIDLLKIQMKKRQDIKQKSKNKRKI